MQTVAQGWLVLKITGSGTALGFVTLLQYSPVLFLSAPMGVLIDRFDRRRTFAVTQALAGLDALLLGMLTITGAVQLWMVCALAFVFGVITSLDQPTRNTFVLDMVGPVDLPNAISLNMGLQNSSRVIGPALAGITIAVFGIGPCFIINAVSYVGVLVALAMMRKAELHVPALEPRAKGQFRAGVRYLRGNREVRGLLVISAIFFGLGWQVEVVFPLVARFTFHDGAGAYAVLLTAMGIGSVGGAIYAARRSAPSWRPMVCSTVIAGASFTLAAIAPTLAVEALCAAGIGVGTILFASLSSSRIQLRSDASMRGRVMAFWAVAVLGVRPIGSLVTGLVGQQFGGRVALAMAAAVIFVVALPALVLLSRRATAENVVAVQALA
jgi:MFS family permease